MIERSDLNQIPSNLWRKKCGVVMQDGHIFSDTIAYNISQSLQDQDLHRLQEAARIACIDSFIESLPMKYKTKIGATGIGISSGQKQRLLIARAIYKDPEILIFDEATSALDATNEKQIQDNLNTFFKNRTVLIIAHRLSTVKNAHKILVLGEGTIIEEGNHESLSAKRGSYYTLVKNQLEL